VRANTLPDPDDPIEKPHPNSIFMFDSMRFGYWRFATKRAEAARFLPKLYDCCARATVWTPSSRIVKNA
jgi:hypothetical protein